MPKCPNASLLCSWERCGTPYFVAYRWKAAYYGYGGTFPICDIFKRFTAPNTCLDALVLGRPQSLAGCGKGQELPDQGTCAHRTACAMIGRSTTHPSALRAGSCAFARVVVGLLSADKAELWSPTGETHHLLLDILPYEPQSQTCATSFLFLHWLCDVFVAAALISLTLES